ncbi:hypothetical protein K3495_g5492 [Podosphaera aphanis]|nr:hypothetical protein K3495_g5492 [Podosphaera aphanis]
MDSISVLPSLSPVSDRNNSEKNGTAKDSSLENKKATENPHNGSSLSPLQTAGRFNEEWSLSSRGSSLAGDSDDWPSSNMAQVNAPLTMRGTLRNASIQKMNSIKRTASRRSTMPGSVRSLAFQPTGDIDERNSAFYSPVPFNGNPTELLAERFQGKHIIPILKATANSKLAWRKVLKEMIIYFREIQSGYDNRAKSFMKILSTLNNESSTGFLKTGGINDAAQIIGRYYKNSADEASKSKDIENEIISALIGLRSDLQLKIKEIKALSGDFKNSVDKEMESTRKAVGELQEGLELTELDPAQVAGKRDPYLLKLAADNQIEKHIAEENYLHQAYLNLEVSGRELEAIVVGEIQRSYKAYADILKREADTAKSTANELESGPIATPKDHEWHHFIQTKKFIDPSIPVRRSETIHYQGKNDELAKEIKAGLMERRSKYLKSFTAGWFVLSPTHLHEFKSADTTQPPVMSLYLPEQKLGPHSDIDSISNKFVLKGRQTGTMHLGHSWVFRCESREAMMSWYEALKMLVDKSPTERNAYVKQRARSSSIQRAGSVGSSDDIVDDDEEEEPFCTESLTFQAKSTRPILAKQSQSGGRFPSSDLLVSAQQQRNQRSPISESGKDSGPENVSYFNNHRVMSQVEGEPRTMQVSLVERSMGDNIPDRKFHVEFPHIQDAQDKNAAVILDIRGQGLDMPATSDEAIILRLPGSPEKQVTVVEHNKPLDPLHVPGEWTKGEDKVSETIEA